MVDTLPEAPLQGLKSLPKLSTGISGLDHVTEGGVPQGRTTLLCGTAGSAKTVLGCQFLASGIRDFDQNGVFVTFEEAPRDICRNMESFGWPIADWVDENRWAFVDGTAQPEHDIVETEDYDFGALIARLEHAIERVGASRIVMDSIGSVFSQFDDKNIVRRELHRIAIALRRIGVTSILTAEREAEHGTNSRYGVEEFVADNVVILRYHLEQEKRRRTIEILKFRGTTHGKGEFPFTIVPGSGISVLPLSAISLEQKSNEVRVTSGNVELDRMCGGGFFRDSIVLVSGATGTGKTLLTTEFIAGGASSGERCLLFGFEESRDQLFRNAKSWGRDFASLEEQGLIRVVCRYPEVCGLEDHTIAMQREIEDFKPARVAIDSLSALERASTAKGYREFVLSMTAFIKEKEIPGVFTATTPTLMGGASVTEAHISTITDSIILLRYVELYGQMHRALTVLKMRGSNHDREIHRFVIDGKGMRIAESFRNVIGILSGSPAYMPESELERMRSMFEERE